jgi:hypothetical protein
LLTNDMVKLPSSNGKTIKDDVPAKAKQFMGHVAIDEQQSPIAFSKGSFLWGQQSCMSSMEEDMSDMSADLTVTAAPPMAGSIATDRAIKRVRMVRPTCMGPLLRHQNSRFPGSKVK